jgi:hypothetical protein
MTSPLVKIFLAATMSVYLADRGSTMPLSFARYSAPAFGMLLRLASDVYPFTCVLSISSQNKAGA